MDRPNPNAELYAWILKRLARCRLEDWAIYPDLEALAHRTKKELDKEKHGNA